MSPDPAPLAGLHAVVTGAGRGIGRGAAVELARAGAEVSIVSRSAEELASVAEEIVGEGGVAHPLVCDLTDDNDLAGLVARLRKVDILVNNAGTNVPQAFCDVDPRTFDAIVRLNLRSVFFTTQAVARRMIAGGDGGAIVNVSSQMGHVGAPRRAAYCATKHAIEGLTKALAVELGPYSIRVNAVAPTYIETAMTAPFFSDPEFRAEVEARIPLGRLGRVEDVSAAIVFLASPSASLITGASLLIDGGYTAQ